MKYKVKLIIVAITFFILGLTVFISASTYNSSEITYDTSTSGAVQNNVKDALDFLYNKTKSGAASECPENMSCVEKPGVTLNVSGPGSVDKGTVYVGIGETNTFTVTPTSGYALHSITCTNGYTLSSFKTVNANGAEAAVTQSITITNPNTANGSVCTITFGSNEIIVSSTQLHGTYNNDTCLSAGEGCICWYIKNGGSNFTYGSHTGCNFKSKKCSYTYDRSGDFDCSNIGSCTNCGGGGNYWYGPGGSGIRGAVCSGVITCAT